MKLFKLVGLVIPLFVFGQKEQTINNIELSDDKHSLYLKGNTLFLPVLIFNVGVEYQLSDHYTLQADGTASPWKSVKGNHFQVYMGHLEGRYYLDQAFRGWYVGLHGGLGVFDLTKWNYINHQKFQRGFNYMLGGTIGYQYQWKSRWNIDLFLGGGNSQGYYHGYEPSEKPPYFLSRYDSAEHWNRSGEWLLYRGGIMISYQLK